MQKRLVQLKNEYCTKIEYQFKRINNFKQIQKGTKKITIYQIINTIRSFNDIETQNKNVKTQK